MGAGEAMAFTIVIRSYYAVMIYSFAHSYNESFAILCCVLLTTALYAQGASQNLSQSVLYHSSTPT